MDPLRIIQAAHKFAAESGQPATAFICGVDWYIDNLRKDQDRSYRIACIKDIHDMYSIGMYSAEERDIQIELINETYK